MTVGKLAECLKDLPQDAEICFEGDWLNERDEWETVYFSIIEALVESENKTYVDFILG